jgi:tetratricopeptide (TPR) repeat protein
MMSGAVSGLAAQTQAARRVVLEWDDSLQQVASSATLADLAPEAKSGPDDARDLRIALYDFRRGTLDNSRGDIEHAFIRLDAVAAGHGSWPWPNYAMAREFFQLSRENAPVVASAGLHIGESHVEAGWRHLREALETDSGFEPARRLALRNLVLDDDRLLRPDERASLAVLLRRPRPEPEALLVRGRVLRNRKQYDSALVAFDSALASGGDRSRLDLERARTLRALDDTAAARRAYWDGLAHLTPAGRQLYRMDLAWMLDPDSLKPFDRVPDDSLVGWMHRFWAERDAAAANLPGERLEEHLRRWVYAFAHFRVEDPWRRNQFHNQIETLFEGISACVSGDKSLYDLLAREQPSLPGDVRHREPLLDHRGLIYLHHGPPVKVAYGVGHPLVADTLSFATPGNDQSLSDTMGSVGGDGLNAPPPPADFEVGDSAIGINESWLYWIDGAWRVLNFRGSEAFGRYAATTLSSYLPVGPATIGDWMARIDLLPEYAAAAMEMYQYQFGGTHLPWTCLPHVQVAIKKSRQDADVATTTDTDTPFVPKPWNAVERAFGLGAGARSGMALVAFAIPVTALHGTPFMSDRSIYDVAFRIVAYQRSTGKTVTVDTVRHVLAPPHLGKGQNLAGWFEIPLAAGDWQIAVRAWQPGDSLGAYTLQRDVHVAPGAGLTLSDIVPGASGGDPWPARDGAVFPLNVLETWPAGGVAQLYFEVGGLPRGTTYRTVITVHAVGGNADLVRLATTDRASGPVTVVRKDLGLSRLKPGQYQLTVTIASGTESVSRQQQIVVERPQS